MRARAGMPLLALAAVLVTGCGATTTPVPLNPVTSVERPMPVGAEQAPPATGESERTPDECDPTASLRPTGLPPAGQMPAGSTMREIQERGRLIAGVDQNTFLFGFRNPTTNTLEGFDIDRAREVADAIFGDPNKIQYKVVTSATRIEALKSGEVDIVVRTMTATCDRWKEINFSAIYYVAGQRLLVDKQSTVESMDQLAGKSVCAAKESTSIAYIAAHPAKPIPVQVDNWSDCLVLLQQGQVAAVSTDDTILAGMAAQDPNLELVGERLTEEPYGIGIPKGKEDMVRFVNAVLERSISTNAWQRSYERWLGATGEPADPPTPNYQD